MEWIYWLLGGIVLTVAIILGAAFLVAVDAQDAR